ncbi:MAG: carbon-nitrogen hydrolase family protein [Phycisphaerae bacterium]|nr:carbon-nitrogen hydrolase family protein [Phycisphaerae bacterium]
MRRSAAVFGLLILGCSGCLDEGRLPAVRSSPAGVRVGGIVLKWIAADKDRNLARAEPLIREAAGQGARIVVTTECFLDGYAIRDKGIPQGRWLDLAEPIPGGDYFERVRRLADELDIHLVAGMLERDGEQTCNTAVLIGPDGRLIGKYRKQDLGHELARNTPGHDSPVFETPYGRVGLIICADRRNAALVRRIAERGVDLIMCPSGGMWGPEKNDFHLQDRSRENRVPIVFVHPIEFLVTAADGSILDRRFVEKGMEVKVEQIGTVADAHLVAICDVPLGVK